VAAERLVLEEGGVHLELDGGRVIEAALAVAADGGNSWARNQAGIAVDNTEYGQTAVVANFRCARPHRQCAYQWFRVEEDGAGGVLAWLPLPGDRFSIVWSVSQGLAERLMHEPEGAFTARVAAAGMHALGELQFVGARGAFPLRNRRARQLAATRFALVGDAAHVLHPLAGQGLNLGFGDCAALYRALEGARDCGDRLRLRAWERERKTALLEMHAVTHGMARLFGATHPLLRAVRNAGLNLGGRIPVLPKLLVQGAIG
jgi:ubiquinone biosynthesis UbiH/UbiF/VisC/COQ6 family hydroxylase